MTAFLDLFSGIGGFALAAYWAGLRFDKHYFSEVDDYAVKVYQKRFPDAENLGDIRNVDYSKLPRGEWLVTSGFPCQPHSDAGLKKGADDERDLWPECRRMLRDLRPGIALFENVRGLLTSPGRDRKGEFFNGVLSDIHECGYAVEWQVISAADAGAPHLRKRVWIVAYAESGKPRRQAEREGREGSRGGSEEKPLAYSESAKRKRGGDTRGRGIGFANDGETLSYAEREGLYEQGIAGNAGESRGGQRRVYGDGVPRREENEGAFMADAESERLQRKRPLYEQITPARREESESKGRCNGAEWWAVEPDVGRVASRVPSRVDRLKCLGNAVVPQCAEMILRLPAFDYWRAT